MLADDTRNQSTAQHLEVEGSDSGEEDLGWEVVGSGWAAAAGLGWAAEDLGSEVAEGLGWAAAAGLG